MLDADLVSLILRDVHQTRTASSYFDKKEHLPNKIFYALACVESPTTLTPVKQKFRHNPLTSFPMNRHWEVIPGRGSTSMGNLYWNLSCLLLWLMLGNAGADCGCGGCKEESCVCCKFCFAFPNDQFRQSTQAWTNLAPPTHFLRCKGQGVVTFCFRSLETNYCLPILFLLDHWRHLGTHSPPRNHCTSQNYMVRACYPRT